MRPKREVSCRQDDRRLNGVRDDNLRLGNERFSRQLASTTTRSSWASRGSRRGATDPAGTRCGEAPDHIDQGISVLPNRRPIPAGQRTPFWRLDAACSTGDTDGMPDEDIPDHCFDEWAARNAKRARNRGTAAAITAALLSALAETGLEGRSVLDVGCGTGDLALAALGHGARSVSGFDLGAGAIANARALADEPGVAERAAFLYPVCGGVQVTSRRRPSSAASRATRSRLRSAHRPETRSSLRLRTARCSASGPTLAQTDTPRRT